jgi:hypothetical protein
MTNFEEFKQFFLFLKVENYLRKHDGNDLTSWTMAKAMHQVVLRTIKVVANKSLFLVMSCDEIANINN